MEKIISGNEQVDKPEDPSHESGGKVIDLDERRWQREQKIIDEETKKRDYTDLGMSPPEEEIN